MDQSKPVGSRIGRNMDELWNERSFKVDLERKHSYQTMFQEKKSDNNTFRKEAIKNIHGKTLLNQLYFSDKNIENVDKKLRYTIYNMSKGQFSLGPQDKNEIGIAMRSVYLRYCKNLPDHITEQIRELNELTVSLLAPKVLSNTKQYIKYLEDINESHMRVIDRPVNVSSAGTKTLEMSSVLGFGNEMN